MLRSAWQRAQKRAGHSTTLGVLHLAAAVLQLPGNHLSRPHPHTTTSNNNHLAPPPSSPTGSLSPPGQDEVSLVHNHLPHGRVAVVVVVQVGVSVVGWKGKKKTAQRSMQVLPSPPRAAPF